MTLAKARYLGAGGCVDCSQGYRLDAAVGKQRFNRVH
jgi:hypothetical protein